MANFVAMLLFTLPSLCKYFENSYLGAVSALVEEEKISVDELRELIDRIETQNRR